MSDSSATQLKSETEIKRRQESSFLEALVPIPDFFFNIKAEIEPIGGSSWVIRILAYFLYFLTLCVMFGSFTYYSLPAQRLSLESLVTSEWQKTGFACKPLQKIALHGLSTDWSFDECLANVIAPDTTNVKAATKHANAIHYDYNFATDGDSNKGVVSFYDDAYASSVSQDTNRVDSDEWNDDWKRDGYSCYPEPPYANTYNLNYNVSECALAVLPPSSDTISLDSVNVVAHMAVGPRLYIGAKYHPFGLGNEVYPVDVNLPTRLLLVSRPGCDGHVKILDDYFYLVGGSIVKNPTCQHGAESNIALDEGIEAWQDLVSTPADGYGNFGTDVVCQKFKQNQHGFRCFDKPKPPATKELAIQHYASEYPPATICEPLKLNSPFQCTRNVEVPATTRLSLSVAAAQAVFAVSGIILVALLRKLRTPPKSAESLSGDDDIRSVVRKLRITVDKLGTELRTGQDKLGTELRTGQDKLSSGHSEHEELIQKLLSK